MGLQFILRASNAARVILVAAAAQSVAGAQVVIKGLLYDDANGTLLRGTVMLVDPSTDGPIVHTTTDSAGQFRLTTSAGTFQIAAVRPGYGSVLSAPVTAQNGESFTVRIPIAAEGDPHHRIAVVEHVRPPRPVAQLATGVTPDGMIAGDAERLATRRAVGTGLQYDRTSIDKSNARTLGEFLQSVSGLSVRDPASTSSMEMTRNTGMSALSPRAVPGAACHVGWFVDGHRMDLPGKIDPITDGLGTMPLDDIAAIEVFRGLAEMPPEFADPELRCGAVAIWTKHG